MKAFQEGFILGLVGSVATIVINRYFGGILNENQ